MAKRNILLGDFLIAQGLITDAQLHQALQHQKEKGRMLGRALIDLDILSEKDLIEALSEQLGVQHVALKNYRIDPSVIKLVPEHVARHFQVVPLFRIDNILTVGMVNPLDVVAIDAVSRACNLKVEPVVCSETDIAETIEQYYGSADNRVNGGSLRQAATGKKTAREELQGQRYGETGVIAKLAETILNTAIRNNATHVHCEEGPEELVVRYRVDGRLSVAITRPQKMAGPLIEQLILLCGIEGSADSAVQSGRMHLQVDGRLMDARLSVVSTAGGRHAVVRLCDRSRLLKLEELGLSSALLDRLKSCLVPLRGLFVVAGPTRSGRTTTLAALVQALRSSEKNVVTLEDPIEYHLEGCRQLQLSPTQGMSFSAGVRAALDQDPDVIMISELRDEETASLAVGAALHGEFVLAGLSAGDAADGVLRLLDMGVRPNLLAAALRGVLAQRLVRKICQHCKVAVPPTDEMKEVLPRHSGQQPKVYRGNGCARCNNTSYHGLSLLGEMLPGTEAVRSQLRGIGSAGVIAAELRQHTTGSLFEDGIRKMLEGITTWEEVLRVVSAG